MRILVPFTHELLKCHTQVLFGFNIHNAQTFALENAEPLCHLIHPRTMYRREVHHNARMLG